MAASTCDNGGEHGREHAETESRRAHRGARQHPAPAARRSFRRALPAFEAGAHLDLHLKDGSTDLWRQYSLCSDPANHAYEIGVLRDPKSRGGSVAVHKLAQAGSTFEVDGPRNHFPLEEKAEVSVLLGGGIGITPMLAMAQRLHALNRDFVLHYCTRSESVTAFKSLIETHPGPTRWSSTLTTSRQNSGSISPAICRSRPPARISMSAARRASWIG